MQQAMAYVAQFNPQVTSVRHGGHMKNSAHYAGRAVDVDSFNGTPVGFNESTWYTVQSLIQSGQFEAIGVQVPQIANSKELQAMAAQYGVNFFYDHGSGPHIHLQVAP